MTFLNNVRMIKNLRPPPDFVDLRVKVTAPRDLWRARAQVSRHR